MGNIFRFHIFVSHCCWCVDQSRPMWTQVDPGGPRWAQVDRWTQLDPFKGTAGLVISFFRNSSISAGRFRAFHTQKCSWCSCKHTSCRHTCQENFHNPDHSCSPSHHLPTKASRKILECSRKTSWHCTTSSLCSPSSWSIPLSSSQTGRCLTRTCTCSQEPGCNSGPRNRQWCRTPMRRCCLGTSIPSPCTFPSQRTPMTRDTPRHLWHRHWSGRNNSLGPPCSCNLYTSCIRCSGQKGCRRLCTFQNCKHSLHQRCFGIAGFSDSQQ